MHKNGLFLEQYARNSYGANGFVVFQEKNHKSVIFIDIGPYEQLKFSKTSIKNPYIFLTHAHYDHIEGIQHFVEDFPSAPIFLSGEGIHVIKDPKRNLSFYHEQPIAFEGSQLKAVVQDSIEVPGFSSVIQVIKSPGHTPDSLSFKIGNFLFTGDSWIPGIPTVTKLKGGNKEQALQTIELLKSYMDEHTIICPGHGPMVTFKLLQSGLLDTSWVKSN
jgi:glyoxylase-like metal-dependent hydrolase (beta-lactamase superfamily II)